MVTGGGEPGVYLGALEDVAVDAQAADKELSLLLLTLVQSQLRLGPLPGHAKRKRYLVNKMFSIASLCT